MAKEMKLVAEPRMAAGTKNARRLRLTGKVPAVVYGEGQAARAIQLDAHGFGLLLHRHAAENILLDLEVDGATPIKVLLREVQHHPLTGHAVHADFVEVSLTRKLRVSVVVHLTGVPRGVSEQGGMLEQITRAVEVEGLPGDILEEITIDVSGLGLGDGLRASGLVEALGAGLTLVSPADLIVAHVVAARAEEAAPVVEGAAVEAGKEPEVLTKKKPEEGKE